MHPFRTSAAAVLAALALAAVPATAVAEDGTAFANCTEAYEHGYANIPASSPYYGKHLDRDGDGIGCDKPPADFKPHEQSGSGTGAGTAENAASDSSEQGGGTDLAETGGNDATPYIAAGGAAVVLLGGGLMIAARRRRGDSA
jgi:LPXTG-motif cell wall-anchored protein